MPVYEYVCQDCNHRFDARVPSWREADSASCESCSSDNIKRVVSRVALMGDSRDIPVTSVPNGPNGGCCGGSCGCHHAG